MMENKEKKLLQRAQLGDRQAIAMLYDQHYLSIYNYIYFRVNDRPTAEDLSAEVFIRMINKLPSYVDRGRPMLAWLYTIARNIVIDHHRANVNQKELSIKDQLLTDQDKGPAQQFQDNQAQDCFRKALIHLPESQRLILIYRFIEEFSTNKILELLNKSDRAVRSLQHRALRSLEKALIEENCL